MKNEKWDYKIDGKMYGITRLFIVGVLLVIFTILAIDQFQPHPNKYIQVALGFTFLACIFFGLFIYLLNRYLNFKIYIGKEGFYYQTNPFNKSYFKYNEIDSAIEEMVVHKHGNAGGMRGVNRTYHYYFTIILNNGQQKKIIFEKSLFEKEFDVLKSRISKGV